MKKHILTIMLLCLLLVSLFFNYRSYRREQMVDSKMSTTEVDSLRALLLEKELNEEYQSLELKKEYARISKEIEEAKKEK